MIVVLFSSISGHFLQIVLMGIVAAVRPLTK